MEVRALANVTVRPARSRDCGDVALIIKKAGLPIDDIDSCLQGFHVAVADGKIVGTVGIEIFGKVGLLRSLAVEQAHRDLQVGSALFEAALNSAAMSGVKSLYLLTTTAAGYFARRGFNAVDRNAVPAAIQTHQQFTSICPSSAILMKREL